MKKENFPKEYQDALNKMREEKMEWSFQDFLQETSGSSSSELKPSSKVIPIRRKPLLAYAASAAVLLLGAAGFYLFSEPDTSSVELADRKVEEAVKRESMLDQNLYEQSPDSSFAQDEGKGKDEPTQEKNQNIASKSAEEEISKILPERGRMKKERKARYVSNAKPQAGNLKVEESKKASTDYQDTYVIINGQKITNEKEAIDVTKYSLRVLSNQVNQTIAQADATFESVEF